MKSCKFAWAMLLTIATIATPTWAASSIADGDWDQGATWDGSTPPDQAANGGNGEEVFVNSDVNVPTGVDFVSTTTIDVNGDPADGNVWMFFDSEAALGSSLTIQDGARVGSKYWTQVSGTGTASVDVLSGGEFVTAGINNGSATFTVDVASGGLLTFDASIHPPYPDAGFYRGNINADTAGSASNVFNIRGRLDVASISNANVGNNSYNLIDGGVINEVPFPGQAIGDVSTNPLPAGSVGYQDIAVSGSGGTVTNAFGGAGITSVPTGLTIDIADQTVFDTNDSAQPWATWVTGNGGDPTMQAGPRRAEIGSGTTDTFTGSGTIQLDFYGFDTDDAGTPGNPADDSITSVFQDQLYNGPGSNPTSTTFSGDFALGYVGPALSDDQVAVLDNNDPSILLINGATNNSFYDNLDGLAVPSQVWSDGTRQYDVTFADLFFFDYSEFPGIPDTRLVFTTIESITVKAGLDGDFDHDGDVDGNDFLVWQRGNSPNGIGSGDLGLWQGNYGAPLNETVSSIVSVPEPSVFSLLGILIVTLTVTLRGNAVRRLAA